MSFFTSADLTGLRALQDAARPDTYEILRTTDTPDDTGGWDPAESVSSTGNCRLRPLGDSAQERIVADRLEWQVAYSIDFSPDANVTPADRVRVNGTRTFRVGGVVRAGNWAEWITAVCQEVG